MALAFKKAPKINELFRSALLKKMRIKDAADVDVNNNDPDGLLKKDLEEQERIKIKKEKALKKALEKIAAKNQDPGNEPPVIKEKWRKRTAKFVTAAFYKEKDAFKRKTEKDKTGKSVDVVDDKDLFHRPKGYLGGPAN